MPQAEKLKVLSDFPQTVTITPMHELVVPFKRLNEYSILVHVFAKTEDDRDRKVLIPTKDARFINTKLQIDVQPSTLPFIFTPAPLFAKSLECIAYQIDEKTHELLVRVHCFNPSSMYLEHGSPLAVLRFVSMIKVQAGG